MPVRDASGRLCSKSFNSKAGRAELGVPGLEEYIGNVVVVSFRLSIGMLGSLSSFASNSVGSVACLPRAGFSPFRADLRSSFLRFLSSSSRALLTFSDTIPANRVLIFRSQ